MEYTYLKLVTNRHRLTDSDLLLLLIPVFIELYLPTPTLISPTDKSSMGLLLLCVTPTVKDGGGGCVKVRTCIILVHCSNNSVQPDRKVSVVIAKNIRFIKARFFVAMFAQPEAWIRYIGI